MDACKEHSWFTKIYRNENGKYETNEKETGIVIWFSCGFPFSFLFTTKEEYCSSLLKDIWKSNEKRIPWHSEKILNTQIHNLYNTEQVRDLVILRLLVKILIYVVLRCYETLSVPKFAVLKTKIKRKMKKQDMEMNYENDETKENNNNWKKDVETRSGVKKDSN